MRTQAREAAYAAIDTERDYQDKRWGQSLSSGRPGDGERSVDEFALYILEYADQMRRKCGTTDNLIEKLEAVRKVAGLCVACLEQHGAPHR